MKREKMLLTFACITNKFKSQPIVLVFYYVIKRMEMYEESTELYILLYNNQISDCMVRCDR